MPKVTRHFAVILTALLMLCIGTSAVFGTGQPSTDGTDKDVTIAENSWKTDTSPVTLEIYMDAPYFTAWEETYWGEEPISKKWIAETGVDIDFVSAPDTEHSMLNLLIASSDLPDIIWADPNLAQVKEMATRGVIWPLNELAAKNAPKFMDHYDKRLIVYYRMLFDSMNFYVAPCFYMPGKFLETPWIVKNYAGTTVVQQLYEEMGSPTVKTADDYLKLLRQVKQKYPDMIPASSNRGASPGSDGGPRVIDKLLPVAGLAEKYFKIGSGWVRYWEHPDFLLVLKYANTLYTERLIDPAELTDKDEQIQAKIFSGRVFFRN
jgi:ABC-type glycerol-3-phosphate transport system substrate-binding protein